MKNEENYYELKYIQSGREVSVKFHGEINMETLRDNLSSFLAGCGWHPSSIQALLSTEYDAYSSIITHGV